MISSFNALASEANVNLGILNAIRTALQLTTLEAIPAELEVITVNDTYHEAVQKIANWAEIFYSDLVEACEKMITVHEGQHDLDSFTVAKANYLNDAKAFEEALKAYAFGEAKEEFTAKVVTFVQTTEDFVSVLDTATTEVENEISGLADRVTKAKTAIDEYVQTIDTECSNVNTAFSAVELNLDLAKGAETSGSKSYLDEIVIAIKDMEVAQTNANTALTGLKNATDDADVIENSESLIRQIDAAIVDAKEMKAEAEVAVVHATSIENQDVLRAIEESHKDITDRKADFQSYLDDADQILTDANTIIAEEHLLMPNKVEAIKNAKRIIEKAITKLDNFETDANTIIDGAKADKKNAMLYQKRMTALSKKVEDLYLDVTSAYKDAKNAIKWIRFYVNIPHSVGEAFAYVAVVPVKQYRKYSPMTKFYRSLFGFGMLVSFLIGAINWSMAFKDLYHSVAAGITAGFVWFFVMYTIDRIFVMSMDKQASKRLAKDMSGWTFLDKTKDYITSGELLFMGLRLVIIYFSSLIVAELMTANIYDREIKQELVVMKAERVQDVNKLRTARMAELTSQQDLAQQQVLPFIVKFKAAAAPLEKVVDDQRAIVKDRAQDYQDEYNGIAKSGRGRGDGTLSKLKKSVLDREEATLKTMEDELKGKEAQLPEYAVLVTEQKKADAEIARLNVLIKDETVRFNNQTSLVEKSSGDGLDQRMTALHRVSANSPWPTRFMIVLFIIEAITLIGKILLGADEHVSNIKSLNEAAEEELLVKKIAREAVNATAMNGNKAIIVDVRTKELAQDETLLQAERKHQNSILEELIAPQGLEEKTRALTIKEGILREFVSKQRSIKALYDELTPTNVNKKNKKGDKAA